MLVQGKIFKDGQLVIHTDYRTADHAGAIGTFQIIDICIYNESILNRLSIDQGVYYHNIKEVLDELGVASSSDWIEEPER